MHVGELAEPFAPCADFGNDLTAAVDGGLKESGDAVEVHQGAPDWGGSERAAEPTRNDSAALVTPSDTFPDAASRGEDKPAVAQPVPAHTQTPAPLSASGAATAPPSATVAAAADAKLAEAAAEPPANANAPAPTTTPAAEPVAAPARAPAPAAEVRTATAATTAAPLPSDASADKPAAKPVDKPATQLGLQWAALYQAQRRGCTKRAPAAAPAAVKRTSAPAATKAAPAVKKRKAAAAADERADGGSVKAASKKGAKAPSREASTELVPADMASNVPAAAPEAAAKPTAAPAGTKAHAKQPKKRQKGKHKPQAQQSQVQAASECDASSPRAETEQSAPPVNYTAAGTGVKHVPPTANLDAAEAAPGAVLLPKLLVPAPTAHLLSKSNDAAKVAASTSVSKADASRQPDSSASKQGKASKAAGMQPVPLSGSSVCPQIDGSFCPSSQLYQFVLACGRPASNTQQHHEYIHTHLVHLSTDWCVVVF